MIDDNKPIAFAHWFKRGVPFVAAVEFDFIYSWDSKRQAFGLLIDEILKFAARCRSLQIVGTAINSIVFNHIVKVGKQKGLEILNSKSINFTARKR